MVTRHCGGFVDDVYKVLAKALGDCCAVVRAQRLGSKQPLCATRDFLAQRNVFLPQALFFVARLLFAVGAIILEAHFF